MSDAAGHSQSAYSSPSASSSDSDHSQPPASWNYEQTVAQIEAIITQIEMGNLELADVFDQFAIAVEQLRQCETYLNQQQQRMDVLIEVLMDDPEDF